MRRTNRMDSKGLQTSLFNHRPLRTFMRQNGHKKYKRILDSVGLPLHMAHTSFRPESTTSMLNTCQVVNLELARNANMLRTSTDIRWAYGCALIGWIATAGGNLATVTLSRSCTAPCVRWNLPEHSGTAGFGKRWIKIAEESDTGEEPANLGKHSHQISNNQGVGDKNKPSEY